MHHKIACTLTITMILVSACSGGGGSSELTPVTAVSTVTPDTPDVPEAPDVPDVPDVPEAPDVPDVPEAPEAPDTVPPRIDLNGEYRMEIEAGSSFIEPGFVATDDTGITPSVVTTGEIDTAKPGSYTISYTAQDVEGNVSSVSRTIDVVDSVPPLVRLIGGDAVTVYVDDDYVEKSVVAEDQVDGDITASVVVYGEVNTQIAGVYALTYTATDSSGNATEVGRTVTVRESNLSISFVDSAPTLMEGSYDHQFQFRFDEIEPIEKTLSFAVSGRSSAEERVDFELITDSVTVLESAEGSFVEVRVFDDRLPEGLETIELTIKDSQGGYLSSFEIPLDDRTSTPVRHGDIQSSILAPSAIVRGDNLHVLGKHKLEEYDLISEKTTASASFFPGIDYEYSDATASSERIFVFGGTTLYELDREALVYDIVSSAAPIKLLWNSELQAHGDKVYIVAGSPVGALFSDTFLVFDLTNETWEIAPSINNDRYGAATTVANDTFFVFGGNGATGSTEAYDLSAGVWSEIPSSVQFGYWFNTAVNLGEYVFITVSDLPGSDTSVVLRFDPTDFTYTEYSVDVASGNDRDSFLYKGRTYLLGGSTPTTSTGKELHSYYIGD